MCTENKKRMNNELKFKLLICTACPKLELEGEDIALILATSGTTGNSKGCIHTQNGLIKTYAAYDHVTNFAEMEIDPMLVMTKQTQ